MAGSAPGQVGFWNCHMRVGGAAGSKVRTACVNSTPDNCKAGWALLHLTNTSSAYVEGMWAGPLITTWTALALSTKRFPLGEASWSKQRRAPGSSAPPLSTTRSTSTISSSPRTSFSAFQQSETPYWQGPGSPDLAPAPWTNNLIASDPTLQHLRRYRCPLAVWRSSRESVARPTSSCTAAPTGRSSTTTTAAMAIASRTPSAS